MPLYDVECPAGHKNEILLSSSEVRDLTVAGPSFQVVCPTDGCGQPATRQAVSLPGSMAVQWRRAAHGSSL